MKTTWNKIIVAVLVVMSFSCKKDVLSPAPVTDFSFSSRSLAVTTINGIQVNTDTIPPSNAVDVKTLGVYGDGVHDDTQALQNALNTHKVLVFKKGTYIINQTLVLPSQTNIYGTNGATIKPGTNMSGTLLTYGRYLDLENVNRNQIINFTFKPSTQAFQLADWATSVIYIKNSQYVSASYNTFNFNQPYQHIGVEAIWVTGASSLQTLIYKNICNTVGITYAESGASGSICQVNTVNNAHSEGIAGYGNGTVYCTKNVVAYNNINNAGYNGIVDYGIIDGTLIKGNTISGSGKSPSEGSLGEGIQAVAVNTIVTGNTISDAQAEYIEVASTNKRIDSNTIIDTKLAVLGIVVNTTQPAQAKATSTKTTLNHNTITGCLNSIQIIGNNPTSVDITNNTINNPKTVGINIISNAPTYTVNITGNIINMTTPNVQARNAILSYSTPLTKTQLATLTNNTITYGTGANGGAGTETAISPHTNNFNLTGNKVIGNNVKSSSGQQVYAINGMGTLYTGYTIVNNTFTGALISLNGFQTLTKSGNNF